MDWKPPYRCRMCYRMCFDLLSDIVDVLASTTTIYTITCRIGYLQSLLHMFLYELTHTNMVFTCKSIYLEVMQHHVASVSSVYQLFYSIGNRWIPWQQPYNSSPGLHIPNLVMTNSSPQKMAHRNRWFTWVYLVKMVIFHGYVK